MELIKSKSMNKYMILGSNSFGGSNFINELLNMDEKVIGISRSKESHNTLLGYSKNKNKNSLFKFYQIDINKNLDEIKKIINEFKPNIIVDFAAQSMVSESWMWPEQWYSTNIVSKVKLHKFLLNKDYLDKYIRISTPEIFGNRKIIKENYSFNPSTPYAVSQAAIDMSLKIFNSNFNFPVIFNRFANFYGPHQQLYRIVPKVILYALLKTYFPLHGKGTSYRSFIHHKDVSQGILKSINNGKLGHSYHFSTNEFTTIYDLVNKICKYLNVETEKFIKFTEDRIGKDKSYKMDNTKSITKLGWEPVYNLDKGIQETIKWIKENFNDLKKFPTEYKHKI